MNTEPEQPLPDSIPCEVPSKRLQLRAFQRECERRENQCLVPRANATRWKDTSGQCYERLKNGQIVRVSE